MQKSLILPAALPFHLLSALPEDIRYMKNGVLKITYKRNVFPYILSVKEKFLGSIRYVGFGY